MPEVEIILLGFYVVASVTLVLFIYYDSIY